MAGVIKLLPDHVANQIAAGEVVQRPASVVKELLENAIDAGADQIKLIVKDGGKALIQVVDNGQGMSTTDSRMCFERHATSKLTTAEELYALKTKGFRGEALASIAAIAHIELQTRTESEEVGTQIRIAGSEVTDQQPIATPKGTAILVKNLFYNIPARRNFLKSPQVESRHITDEFHRVALAHPDIAFQYFSNGSELFQLPKTNLRKRIVHVFGSKTNEKLVPVTEETQMVKVSGFLCKPEFAKKSRGEQFFFVNNRFIKSPYLHHAVMNAFEGLIRPNTFPGYFLYLEMDPSSIDVNIHPTKTEIKFHDDHSLYAILRSALKHSLGQFNVAPVLDFEKDPNLETPYAYRQRSAEAPSVEVDSAFNPFSGNVKPVSGFKKATKEAWEALYLETEKQAASRNIPSQIERDPVQARMFEKSAVQESGVRTFQFKQKYVVSSIKSGMLIIHQNRAHQRVLYNKFLKELSQNNTVSQQLLFPLSLSFSKSDMDLVREIQTELIDHGFLFEEIGEEQLTLSGVPIQITEGEVGIVIDELIATRKEGAASSFSTTELLAQSMCRAMAIKTGSSLDTSSQQGLVNDLFACKESGRSPFNKTVYIVISENDIENKFN
ncbi:MAG: DNA mismatch repair endonuclease MutL [Flavobacteriaceae bacterium]|nr:DNA mismatch repair endonuclease MutL [Flavobacteriaceae bacterium]